MYSSRRQQTGFTLFELIMVIVLLGILAISANALFPSTNPYASMAARDQLIATARFAQQTAMSRGPNVAVTLPIAASSYQILIDGAAIELPGGGTSVNLPTGATVTTGTISYDSLGDVTAGAGAFTISVSGETDRTVTIESSGYAH